MIGATGVLTQPKPPEIAGLDDFRGTTMHTARWDDDVDLRGKRVAIIGTGASAVQIIPEIAPLVEQLTVFQRTPIWCLPKPDAAAARGAALRDEATARAATSRRAIAGQAFVEVTFPLPLHFGRVLPVSAVAARDRQGLPAPAGARPRASARS